MESRFATTLKNATEPWRWIVCTAVVALVALSLATDSFRTYHLLTLVMIPCALLVGSGGRRFFVDWAPLFTAWITYDRMRLLQTAIYERVWVDAPYAVERWLFGWMANGQTPPHAARTWLAAHSGVPLVVGVSVTAQLVYLSHLFVYPALFLFWWLRGRTRARDRSAFVRHVRAFTILHALGFLGYVLVPAAPPWWVSLNGMAQPSIELVAAVDLTRAMDGAIVQHTIATAPQWFAAVPSLHGAYPVLLLLLAGWAADRRWLAAIVVYGTAMWAATVVLNQHYIVDLLAGALVAVAAYYAGEWLERRRLWAA